MKFISWNVNGIRACVQKGFLDFFKEADADIFCKFLRCCVSVNKWSSKVHKKD